MRSRIIMLLALAGALACREQHRPVASSANSIVEQARRNDPSGQAARARFSAIAVTAAEDVLPQVSPADVANMVIRTATVSIEVDSLNQAVAQVRQLAGQVGGYVASTNITTGKNQLRNAQLEVKVPADRFDESLSGLAPIGKVESVSVEAEDVGEQFVDVTARMENARRLERRLIDLLATRTGKLKDVLDVEQTLARVREEIERYEGRIRYLRAHTAMSTLSIGVHEPVPIVATAGRGPIGEAFRQAWRNFVVLTAFAVQSLGVVLPLGVLAIAGWMLTRRVRLARQRAA